MCGPNFLYDRQQVFSVGVGPRQIGRSCDLQSLRRARISQLNPPSPGGSQPVTGALRDHVPLLLRHERHDANRKLVRVGHVYSDEIHAAVTEVQEEGGVPGQPVEFGDEQGRSLLTAEGDGLLHLLPVIALAAFDFGKLRNQLPIPAIEVSSHRIPLGIHAKAVDTLFGRADPVVGDEFPSHHRPQYPAGWVLSNP